MKLFGHERHRCADPWDGAPPWALEIGAMLDYIIQQEFFIMSQLSDALDQAEAAAKANSDADDAAEKLLISLAQMITDLKAAGTDPATVARITALSQALTTRASALSAAVVAGTPAA